MLIRDWLAVKVEVTGIPCAPECCAHRDFDKLTTVVAIRTRTPNGNEKGNKNDESNSRN